MLQGHSHSPHVLSRFEHPGGDLKVFNLFHSFLWNMQRNWNWRGQLACSLRYDLNWAYDVAVIRGAHRKGSWVLVSGSLLSLSSFGLQLRTLLSPNSLGRRLREKLFKWQVKRWTTSSDRWASVWRLCIWACHNKNRVPFVQVRMGLFIRSVVDIVCALHFFKTKDDTRVSSDITKSVRFSLKGAPVNSSFRL